MPYGPWIQDPDITVQAGRLRSHYFGASSPPIATASGPAPYTVATINAGMQGTVLPSILVEDSDTAEDYPYLPASAPFGIFAEYAALVSRSAVSWEVSGAFTQESYGHSPYPHGWSGPPFTGDPYEIEGGADPVVVAAHLEHVHTQAGGTDRTPDFSGSATLYVYRHLADVAGNVTASTRSLLTSYPLTYTETTGVVGTTIHDLTGAELDAGIVINPYIQIGIDWQFSSGVDISDTLAFRVETLLDLANSYYVWRPPRYRYLLSPPTAPARRIYPRTDSVGPGIGRFYPPPNTPQSGSRIGSAAPY